MKRRIILLFGLIIAFLFLSVRFQSKRDSFSPPQISNGIGNGQKSEQASGPEENSNKVGHSATNLLNRDLIRERAENEIIERWRAPIVFFGKVIDENEKEVEGANVEFLFNTTSGTSRRETTSGDDGSFRLENARGYILSVHVVKEGYYSSKQNQTMFYYGRPGENHTPTEQRPIVFRLRKMQRIDGLLHVKKNFRVARDGTPLQIDLQSGRAVSNDQGHLRVECWTNDAGVRSGERYDWRCRISVPNGGLIESTNEFDFVAPEDGYQKDVTIQFDKNNVKGWVNDVEKSFFFKGGDGRFGRLKFAMVAGGDHFCMIDSFLNPTGSRDLEN